MSILALVIALSASPDAIPAKVADRQDFQHPANVRLSGMLGDRIEKNAGNRMLAIDVDRLLEGYRKRPGRQAWDGEHVGKWLHAATLAWANTGNPALRSKLDSAVAELLKCQLDDGYLGTYLPKDRWTEWDVWAHKYNLIGLLTYIRYTGNETPLPACRKMVDLLCASFGDESGKRDIITAGHHVGMAPTSVLEPMVLLYRLTGEKKYGDFCRYILRAWEQPNGPKIVSRLLELKRVDKVGNAKAYEMLSCLNGLLEWYRVTGDVQYFEAALNAWKDIVENRLYITGTASAGEHFRGDHDLPNRGNVGETCVTVTWIQFNAQLLRLTGEARFADELERSVYNQLCGAQRPDGKAWGYYVEMEGKKPYSATLDGHCCLSSGPRGMALIPTFALTTDADGVVVNFYDAGKASLTLHDGTKVAVEVRGIFPASEKVEIIVNPEAEKAFAVKLRIPPWCSQPATLHAANGEPMPLERGPAGYAELKRTWKPGERLELILPCQPRLVLGDHTNKGKAALQYGPLVLAVDQALSPVAIDDLAFTAAAAQAKPEAVPQTPWTWPAVLRYAVALPDKKTGRETTVRMVPFATAGAEGSPYKVWLPMQ